MKRRARAQPEVARMPTSSFPVWRMAGIVLAGLVVYANSLGGPFVFDDMGTIVQNPTIRAMGTAWHPPASTAVAGRPVVNISFAMNYFAGQLDVAGYHAVN